MYSSTMSPPMYASFSCDSTDFAFSECNNPSGLTPDIANCGLCVIGVHCVGM